MCRGFLLRGLTTRTAAKIGDTKRLHFQTSSRLICKMLLVIRSAISSSTPVICSRVMQTKFAFQKLPVKRFSKRVHRSFRYRRVHRRQGQWMKAPDLESTAGFPIAAHAPHHCHARQQSYEPTEKRRGGDPQHPRRNHEEDKSHEKTCQK